MVYKKNKFYHNWTNSVQIIVDINKNYKQDLDKHNNFKLFFKSIKLHLPFCLNFALKFLVNKFFHCKINQNKFKVLRIILLNMTWNFYLF